MKAFISELDGTTFSLDIHEPWPELRMPVRNKFIPCFEEKLQDFSKPVMSIKRYKRIGVSEDIVFYDRIVDAEEIR